MKLKIDGHLFFTDSEEYHKNLDSFLTLKDQEADHDESILKISEHEYLIHLNNDIFHVDLESLNSNDGKIFAPLKGIVQSVVVKENDEVKAGQKLIQILSMKLQNDILAEFSGRVVRVLTKPGRVIEKGQLLMEIEKYD